MEWEKTVSFAMSEASTPHSSLLTPNSSLYKLHIVANYEGRSANSQINILIRDCIAAYEKEHGRIELS